MNLRMNPKTKFREILGRYGRDVLIVRASRKLKCECFNEVNREASRRCPLCFGLGWTYTAERHTVYAVEQAISRQSPPMLNTKGIGDVNFTNVVFYTLPECQVNSNDLIIEVDWDSKGRPTYNGRGVYKANRVNSNNMIGNDMIYKACYASIQLALPEIRGINASKIRNVTNYRIALEG